MIEATVTINQTGILETLGPSDYEDFSENDDHGFGEV